jgi:hypothetical protein
MAQRRIIIPLYGPHGLRFDPHPLIVERLGVPVAEPMELPSPLRELPFQPPPQEPNRPEPKRATPPDWPPPRRRKNPEIAYFADPYLRGISPELIEFEDEYFSPIEHHGLIVVIGAASFLPRETFSIVEEHAERSGLIIPIYVRGLK